MARIPIKQIIDEMNKEGFSVTYPSFMQFYKLGKINKDVTDLIEIEKRVTNQRYMVSVNNIAYFKVNLKKQFS